MSSTLRFISSTAISPVYPSPTTPSNTICREGNFTGKFSVEIYKKLTKMCHDRASKKKITGYRVRTKRDELFITLKEKMTAVKNSLCSWQFCGSFKLRACETERRSRERNEEKKDE